MSKFLFWFSLFVLFYIYIGYGLMLLTMLWIRGLFKRKEKPDVISIEPEVSLIIAAYNEETFIEKKILNSLDMDYPAGKLRILVITDGSTDRTPEIISRFPEVRLLHLPQRQGKVAAVNRAMAMVDTRYVIFTDANSLLNRDCIRKIVDHYKNPKTGGVAGEKKILSGSPAQQPAGTGESLYWKYESWLKKLDSGFYTVVGAAGELFSLRAELFKPLPADTIIEDFVQSLQICKAGYVIDYEPDAYASEWGSASIKEEQKRKIRIAAGAFQAMGRLRSLFNPFRYPVLSFQLLSHRISRWTIGPLLLPLLLISNAWLVFKGSGLLYELVLLLQILFYTLALIGWLLAARNTRIGVFYVPYYFFFMNLSVYMGFFRFLEGGQTAIWDKAERAPDPTN
ncbi:MAG TPA: glycosyltransferase family 2 protein [Puia sp.]|nr:glycosyltransferase family 2 protein [Puia sp.]